MSDDDSVPGWMRRYPAPHISPQEYESFVGELFRSASGGFESFELTKGDRVTGVGGTFRFDATVRLRWGGMNFLILIEAKHHRNPIKRELVQVLHGKLLSVGAQKAVMFSTSPYQRGALEFAKVNRIALVTLTEGRFTIETRGATPARSLTREQAHELYGLPTFVGLAHSAGDHPGTTRVLTVSSERPDLVREALFPSLRSDEGDPK